MKVFKEEQRFTQLWLIVLLSVSVFVPIVIIIQEYTKEGATLSTAGFIKSIVLIVGSILLIFVFKLTTRIDEKGVHYQFFPFHFKLKTIEWKEMKKAFVRTYSPITEYGGWGLKGGWSKARGKAINVSGDIGIQLELANGKKLLIGTQKKTEAERVLETYKTKLHQHD